jgi:SAM-dependent methyltransferase
MNSQHFSCYILDEDTAVFCRGSVRDFAYSDGEAVEDGLLQVLRAANDVSSDSEELEANITDWPSRYHLSRSRANLLRPYRDIFKGAVLEIGAGCGAITRYLGECGAEVTAVEGSLRRAAVAAARIRGLDNVRVVCDRIQDFESDTKYDVVTLIGVLEYAQMFGPSSDAPFDLLSLALSFLKPGGKLVLAIENRMGLKYFAGMPEDHVNHGMYGVEGLYRPSEPVTFGRDELTNLLCRAGFTQSRFAYPFPDYKLPKSVVSDLGARLKSDVFNSSAFAAESASDDPQIRLPALFSLESAWQSVGRNGLLQDLANSFLVVASADGTLEDINRDILAWHFSTSRRGKFAKATLFRGDGHRILVERTKVNGGKIEPSSGDAGLRFSPVDEQYIVGDSFRQDFATILARPFWSIDDVCVYFRRYVNFLTSRFGERNVGVSTDAGVVLQSQALDLLPQNLLVVDGSLVVIDEEWSAGDGVELGYMLFRAVMYLLNGLTRCGYPQNFGLANFGSFILAVFGGTLGDVSTDLMEKYWDREAKLQANVAGLAPVPYASWASRSMPILDPSTVSIARMIVEVQQGRISSGIWQDVSGKIAQFITSRSGESVTADGTREAGQPSQIEPAVLRELVEAAITSRDKVILDQVHTIASNRRSLDQLYDEIHQLSATYQEGLAARDDRLVRLQGEIDDWQRQLSIIKGSLSWRVTKPLRWIRRVISKGARSTR